jgi:hypothetical protein
MTSMTILVRKCHFFVVVAVAGAMMFGSERTVTAAVTFSPFVTSSAINGLLGQNNTIAFNYAGNKFVGSVYYGANNQQLYSTDLNGGNIQKFGSPLPTTSPGEVVIGASLGQAGFATGDVFAGSQADLNIYHFSNDGSTQSLFATLPSGGGVRQIFFDPGSSFGGNMLVTTFSGDIFRINSAGTPTLLASIGEDTEGMDIAPSSWTSVAGQLLVASEGSGKLRFVSPTGVVTDTNVKVSAAETVSFVPANFGDSGNPLEGFYVANYDQDIQKAGNVSEFAPYKGDAIITSEFGSNSPLWDLKYNGGIFLLDLNPIGNLPNQSEDGIFVTAERVNDLVPEPSTLIIWSLLGGLGIGVGWWRKRKAA